MDDRQAVNLDEGFLFAIQGVKVWWTVVVEVHADDDPVEPTKLRHVRPAT